MVQQDVTAAIYAKIGQDARNLDVLEIKTLNAISQKIELTEGISMVLLKLEAENDDLKEVIDNSEKEHDSELETKAVNHLSVVLGKTFSEFALTDVPAGKERLLKFYNAYYTSEKKSQIRSVIAQQLLDLSKNSVAATHGLTQYIGTNIIMEQMADDEEEEDEDEEEDDEE